MYQRLRELLQHTVVGGMPDTVQTFVNTKRTDEVLQIQRDIVRSHEDDMVKYADKKDKPVIRECFQSIPKQLSNNNVGRAEQILTLPLYMAFLLTDN